MIINGHSHDMNTQSLETLGWGREAFTDRKRLLDIKIQEAVRSIEISIVKCGLRAFHAFPE